MIRRCSTVHTKKLCIHIRNHNTLRTLTLKLVPPTDATVRWPHSRMLARPLYVDKRTITRRRQPHDRAKFGRPRAKYKPSFGP